MGRWWLGLLALVAGACAPTYLGSVPYHPYDLDDFPVFTSPAGAPLYGQRRYLEQRGTAVARGAGGRLGFFITLEFGLPARPTPPFPDPVFSCRFASADERPAAEVRLVPLELPPGFAVYLEKARYRLRCGPFERLEGGLEVLRYTTWLEVLYRFEMPLVAPGTYRLAWQLWEGNQLLAEEDRRFTLTQSP
ncbi:hypothetical protein [Meiothermus rufus]|uniref:hypothetical protein n=1 Tax=Meiothermus rufus TaxID=604332 RepID=UPI0003F934AD|nr:hypothetical protein [Meiothermus rufus]